ncbi:MAG: type II toxin-antitoxin system VapC family toxin [Deltaproteobacteria bacterium]|nr:type II toxin-antitoxin system VapC family toxin [Deltaproteobacteria bacterium]
MIVLDTCTLLWLVNGELPPAVAERIANHDDAVLVTAVSAWEIGVKHAKGKLVLPMPPAEWWARVIDAHGLGEVPIEPAVALHATQLPPLHADPADRMIVATAMVLRATLLTPDPLIRAYPGLKLAWG